MSSGSTRRRRYLTSIGPRSTRSSDNLLHTSGPASVRRWELWTLGRSLLAYVLAVEAAALGMTVVLIGQQHLGLGDLVMMGAIIGLGLGKEELTRHVERMRRRFSDTPHQNMTSPWTFAAALVLPPGLAIVVVATLYTYLWLRIWSPLHAARAWKVVFSASTVVLSCHSATVVLRTFGSYPLVDWRNAALVTAAILVYSAVNLGLVAGAIALMSSERTLRRLFGTADDAALEYTTLAIGGVAVILLHEAPGWVVLLVPALVVLHKNVLVRQLEEAASTDPKTGVLNATTWQFPGTG